MPHFTVDLHNHTPLLPRDYRGPLDTAPRRIVESALDRGLDVYAVTDHFSVGFYERLIAASDEVAAETGRRLLVVPGAELKVRYRSDEVHVIALLPPTKAGRLFDALVGILGLTAPVAPVEELHRVTVTYEPRQVFKIIEALGGIGIVGHIDRAFGDYKLLDSPFADELLASEHVRAVELLDSSLADRLRGHQLTILGSSDSHSTVEIGRRMTRLEMAEPSFSALREALSMRAAVAV